MKQNDIDGLKQLAVDGPVVLTEESLDAKKRVCHEGTQIAPKVDGWPEHRVLNHLIQKKAKKGTGTKPTHKAEKTDEHEKDDAKHSGTHGR